MWGHDEKFFMQKQYNFKIYLEILVSKPFLIKNVGSLSRQSFLATDGNRNWAVFLSDSSLHYHIRYVNVSFH